MQDLLSRNSLLTHAERLEAGCDWSEAAEVYEKLGYALYRAARQADMTATCRDRLIEALASYQKSCELYPDAKGVQGSLAISRNTAMAAFLRFWLGAHSGERKRLIDEAWTLADDALELYRKEGDPSQYAETYDRLALVAIFKFLLEWDIESRKEVLEEMVGHGENILGLLSRLRSPIDVAKAYAKTALFLESYVDFLEAEEREEYYQRARRYWANARQASEEAALLELSIPRPVPPWAVFWGVPFEEVYSLCKKSVDVARSTRDKLLIGSSLNWLYILLDWDAYSSEDPDRRTELMNRTTRCNAEAKHLFSLLALPNPFEDWSAEVYLHRARVETNPETKRGLLDKALDAVGLELKEAESSGYPERFGNTQGTFSKILAALAGTHGDVRRRREFLEEALGHTIEQIRTVSNIAHYYWHQGVSRSYMAEINYELACLQRDPSTARAILEDAIKEKEASLELIARDRKRFEGRGPIPQMVSHGTWLSQYGRMLERLHSLSLDKKDLTSAARTYQLAAESFQKIGNLVRASERYWKAAEIQDSLGNHLEAAETFTLSQHGYKAAAEKIPQLKSLYLHYSTYMEVWAQIEQARHHHRKQEYGPARESYEKASILLESSNKWDFLAPNYRARSQFERAEELSESDKNEQAVESFTTAIELLGKTKQSLDDKIRGMDDQDERATILSFVKGVSVQERYINGRLLLEEARILYKRGDSNAAFQEYRRASDAFETSASSLASEDERKEVALMAHLSKAWQALAQAESEARPDLYFAASRLFEETKELTDDPKVKMLLLGHSRFSKALESGSRYLDTRSQEHYLEAVNRFDSAADYYAQAGQETASEYSKATRLLFDAYVTLNKAHSEEDSEKKTKLLAVTERILASSARSFETSGHPGKRGQVLTLIDKVKEEKELATSILKLLQPTSFPVISEISSPFPGYETASGREQFEHGNIQARILTTANSLKLGEEVEVRMELVNAGDGPATLVSLENSIPEGFDLVEPPPLYRIEKGRLDLKERRLDPLRVEGLKLVLKPRSQGLFILQPRVIYLDETGRKKTHQAQPLYLLVSPVLEFLVKSFVEDSMGKRLSTETSGWRTLMNIVNSLRIPKSQIYGDARKGHSYGKLLETLLKGAMVEFRVFPGERGRGGRIVKVRVRYDQDPVRKIIENQVLRPIRETKTY